jgi:hypothetical protein
MDRIAPRLIVPTHAGGDSWPKLRETYGEPLAAGEVLRTAVDKLPEKTRVVALAHPKE